MTFSFFAGRSSMLVRLAVLLIPLTWFWPAVNFDFVLHDDVLEIVRNPAFSPVTATSLGDLWREPDFSRIYIPVNYTFLGAIAEFSRWIHHNGPLATPNPQLFHAAGLLVHTLNTWLVFLLLRRALADNPPHWFSAAGAIIFALHPAQVESVARAGNLTVTLGGFWSLLSVLFFVKFTEKRRFWTFAAFNLFFILAILTRPSAVALPGVFLIIGWAQNRTSFRKLIPGICPALLIAAVYTGATVWMQNPARSPSSPAIIFSRMLIGCDSLLWYAAQSLWPSKLTVDHGHTPEAILARPGVWISIISVCACIFILKKLSASGRRREAACVMIFLCMLLPVSGFWAAPHRDSLSVVYDRHLYLPIAALAVLFCLIVQALPANFQLAAAATVTLAAATASRQYLQAWRDSESLFRWTVQQNPHGWYGQAQLGTTLLLSGRPAEAVPWLRDASRVNPYWIDAKVNLGQALLQVGENKEAEAVLKSAIGQGGDQATVFDNFAVALLRRNSWAEAKTAAETALRINPVHPTATGNLALALAGEGNAGPAVEIMREFLRRNPAPARMWRILAEIEHRAGGAGAGAASLERACQIEPANREWSELLRRWKDDLQN